MCVCVCVCVVLLGFNKKEAILSAAHSFRMWFKIKKAIEEEDKNRSRGGGGGADTVGLFLKGRCVI